MNPFLNICRTATVVAVFFLFASPAAAQQAAKFGPSYDVVLQVVVGSNEAKGGELPRDLAGISRQLRSQYAFSRFTLANTFLGRVGDNGNLEYKSMANFLSRPGSDTPAFLDWSLTSFNAAANIDPKREMNAQSFRFGARVPVRLGGRPDGVVNYESIGLSLSRVGISVNTPTLLGTLSLPETAGTMFLILTVKPAEQ